MAIVQTEWWCLEIPEEWSAEQEDDCVSIIDCDDVGSIDITVVKKPQGDVEEADLREFAEDLLAEKIKEQKVSVGNTKGLLFEFDEDDLAWREWYLACGSVFVYITYHADIENKGLDNAVVDEILGTLVVLDEA